MNNGAIVFYRIWAWSVLLLEFFGLFLISAHFSSAITSVAWVLIIPPTLLILIRQYVDDMSIPLPFVLVFCSTFLELGVCGPLRGYVSLHASAAFGFTIFSIVTFVFIKRSGTKIHPYLVPVYLLIGVSVIQLPIRIFYFQALVGSLPDYLMHLLGITAGFFFWHQRKLVGLLNIVFSVLLILYVYFSGYSFWLKKTVDEGFANVAYTKTPDDITLTDINNAPLAIKKERVTVMDFWVAGYRPCFNSFPAFQKYYNQYKNNPSLQFYAVNQPLGREVITDNFKLLGAGGYTFPVAAAGRDKALVKALDIHVYPTTVVIDEKGFVIYKGDLKDAMATVKNYLP